MIFLGKETSLLFSLISFPLSKSFILEKNFRFILENSWSIFLDTVSKGFGENSAHTKFSSHFPPLLHLLFFILLPSISRHTQNHTENGEIYNFSSWLLVLIYTFASKTLPKIWGVDQLEDFGLEPHIESTFPMIWTLFPRFHVHFRIHFLLQSPNIYINLTILFVFFPSFLFCAQKGVVNVGGATNKKNERTKQYTTRKFFNLRNFRRHFSLLPPRKKNYANTK